MRRTILLSLFAVVFGCAAPLRAAEHPEHPTAAPAEHPSAEHPTHAPPAQFKKPTFKKKKKRKAVSIEERESPPHNRRAANPNVSIEDVAAAVRRYVRKDAKMKGGYYMVFDKKAGKPLMLKLDKIHKERLAAIKTNLYFVCADFVTPTGKVYDLDIFMKGRTARSLRAVDVAVHKEAGKPRYTWYQSKSGLWKKKFL